MEGHDWDGSAKLDPDIDSIISKLKIFLILNLILAQRKFGASKTDEPGSEQTIRDITSKQKMEEECLKQRWG